jgi:hypothetical protein
MGISIHSRSSGKDLTFIFLTTLFTLLAMTVPTISRDGIEFGFTMNVLSLETKVRFLNSKL